MGRFADRTVLVTGASRGLGRSIAVAFGSEGAFVAVGYRTRANDANTTLAEVRARGGDGVCLALDVRDAPRVEEAVRAVLDARGGIDVLVNNAAITHDERFATSSRESYEEVLRVNVDGTMHACRAVVRPMMGKGRGAIVNVASVSAVRAGAGRVAYATSKGGILALTRALAAELAPSGIRVNAIVPGLLDVGMGARAARDVIARTALAIPLGRVGTGDEAARAVLFLASDDASYIVGECLAVDGGLSL